MREAGVGAGGQGGPAGAAREGVQVPGGAAGEEPTGPGTAAAGLSAEPAEVAGGPGNGGERKKCSENSEAAHLALESKSTK